MSGNGLGLRCDGIGCLRFWPFSHVQKTLGGYRLVVDFAFALWFCTVLFI